MLDQDLVQNDATIELLSFEVGGQDYAIDIGTTREIRSWTPPAHFPDTPDSIMGLLNLRGELIPLVNLAICLGLPSLEINERSVVVVAEINGSSVGLLVDAVSDIIDPKPDEMRSPPEETRDKRANLVASLVHAGEKTIRVLDLESVVKQASVSSTF